MTRLVAIAAACLFSLTVSQSTDAGDPSSGATLTTEQENNVRRLLARPRVAQAGPGVRRAAGAMRLASGPSACVDDATTGPLQAPPRVQRTDETPAEVQKNGPQWIGTGRTYLPWAGGPVYDPYVTGNQYDQYVARRVYNAMDMNARRERIYAKADRSLEQGLEQLYRGQYQRAVMTFRLAAELDQGDPAARIHLAQALLATGRCDEAGRHLRRALSLQPKLLFVASDWTQYFGAPMDCTARIAELRRRANAPDGGAEANNSGAEISVRRGTSSKSPATMEEVGVRADDAAPRIGADALFLLGYLEFQSGANDAAQQAFRRSARLGRTDDALREYLRLTH